MADIVITPADVVAGAEATVENGTAGATIAAGETVYKDTADSNKWKLADANNTSLTATVKGIALNGATNGQPLAVQVIGEVTMSAVLTAGKVYVQSASPGKIAPVADLATGWRTSLVGVAKSTTSLRLAVYNSDTLNA